VRKYPGNSEALDPLVGEEASTLGRLSILRARMKPDLFPNPNPEERGRVGEAARRLVELRDGWLNPPGLDPAELTKRTLTNPTTSAPPGSPTPTPTSTPPSSPRTFSRMTFPTLRSSKACSLRISIAPRTHALI